MKYAPQIRLENLGFIYQHHHLLGDFTAQENAAMPLLIAGIEKDQALQRAEDLLAKLGLGERLYNLPGELSGGEQQRVAIARALINNPKLILVKEVKNFWLEKKAYVKYDNFRDRPKCPKN